MYFLNQVSCFEVSSVWFAFFILQHIHMIYICCIYICYYVCIYIYTYTRYVYIYILHMYKYIYIDYHILHTCVYICYIYTYWIPMAYIVLLRRVWCFIYLFPTSISISMCIYPCIYIPRCSVLHGARIFTLVTYAFTPNMTIFGVNTR